MLIIEHLEGTWRVTALQAEHTRRDQTPLNPGPASHNEYNEVLYLVS